MKFLALVTLAILAAHAIRRRGAMLTYPPAERPWRWEYYETVN